MCKLNSKCFLCLNNVSPPDNDNNNSSASQVQSRLFALSNYLNISNFITNPLEIESISICEECKNLLQTFGLFLRSLDIAQMKVDSCIKQIRDVMLIRKLTDLEKHIDKLEILRRNIIKKSLLKLKESKSQPVVKILRTKITRISAKLIPPSSPVTPESMEDIKTEPKQEVNEADDEHGSDCIDDCDNNGDFQMYLSHSNCNENVETAPNLLEEGRDKHKLPEIQNNSKLKLKYVQCKQCQIRLHKSSLCKHMRRCKKNAEFPNKQIPTTTTVPTPKEIEGGKYLRCPFCRGIFLKQKDAEKAYPNSQNGFWRYQKHLIQYHCEQYFPNQKQEGVTDSKFQKLLAELLFKGLVDGRDSCVYCPKTFINPSNSETNTTKYQMTSKSHYLEAHLSNLQEKVKEIQQDPDLREKLSKSNPNGEECIQCGTYLPCTKSWMAHANLFCKTSTITRQVNWSTRKAQCERCSKTLLKRHMKRHLRVCGKVKTTKKDKSSEKYPSPRETNGSKSVGCPFCRAKFNGISNSYRQHLIQYHCEYFFPDQKKESVTEGEFRKILAELLFEGLIEGRQSCALCSRTFLSCFNVIGRKKDSFPRLKQHYIDFHYNYFEEKLKEIQEDPNLREKLRKSNPRGMFCDKCGTYVTCHLGLRMHIKLHCNYGEKGDLDVPGKLPSAHFQSTSKIMSIGSKKREESKSQAGLRVRLG